MVKKRPAGRDQARAEVHDLMAWRPVSVDASLIHRAWKIEDRYRLSFWDALIISAAKSVYCRYLLTEDLQDEQMLDGVRVLNPFLHRPEELIEAP